MKATSVQPTLEKLTTGTIIAIHAQVSSIKAPIWIATIPFTISA